MTSKKVASRVLVRMLLLAYAQAAVAQSNGASATASIYGTVRDSAGAPIAGASVSVTDPGRRTVTTNSNGTYELTQLEAGSYRLIVRRIGYRPRVVDADLEPRAHMVLDVLLRRAIPELPGIEVRDTSLVPQKYRFTSRYDAFFLNRKTATSGIFLDRDEMERRGGVAHALANVNGVRASENMGTLSVRLPRCTSGTPAVIVDGVLSSGSVLSTIPISSIELIEVYRSIAEMPAVARGNGCGAIVVYTH